VSVVAVIPARGGSKGVPDKNLRAVGGVSLLGRAVASATSCPAVDRVLVSTDSARLAAEARRFGAEVVDRPAHLAGDTASSEAALLHALEAAPEAEVVAFLQCTSPFLTSEDLARCVEPVADGRAEVAFTATPFHGFVWRGGQDGVVTGVNHREGERLRRQDRPAELLETGGAYVMDAAGFRAAGHRFFGRVVAVEVDPRRAMEIDTPEDLELARHLASLLDAGGAQLRLPVPALLALDFDGVFTDNRVLVDEDGREAVWCHRGDGHGLAALREVVPIVVLSTEQNPVVAARCEKLGLPYVQGLGADKETALRRVARERGVDLEEVAFVGNDVNDLGCFAAAGLAVAVADAVPEVRAAADYVLSAAGGHGALRELADAVLAADDQKG